MKTLRLASLLIPVAVLLAGAAPAFAEPAAEAEKAPDAGFVPKEYSLSRYDHLNKKSPFEFDPQKPVETVAVDPFEGVSLAGYIGSGKTMTVFLLVGKEKKRVTVYGDGSPYKKRDDSGFRVVGINRGKTLKTTAVTIEKDGQNKEIMFEEDALRPKGGGGAAPGAGVQMVPGPDGKLMPRPVIPRPNNGMPQQGGYQAPQAYIPGQTPAPVNQPQGQMQPGQQNSVLNNAQIPQQAQMGNNNAVPQQQINQLLTPQVNGQTPQRGGRGGEDNVRNSVPPTRRRVVLPTQ